MYINELNTGDHAEGFFLLESVYAKQASNGKPFLSVVLGDRTGSMEGKVWDYPGPIGASDSGAVVWIKGTVSEFRGAKQMNVECIRLADGSDRYPISDLIPTAPIDVHAAWQKIEAYVIPLPTRTMPRSAAPCSENTVSASAHFQRRRACTTAS